MHTFPPLTIDFHQFFARQLSNPLYMKPFVLALILIPLMLPAQRLERMSSAINSSSSPDYYPQISPSGKHFYFIRFGHPDNSTAFDEDIWYSSRQEDGSWSRAVNMGKPLNNVGSNGVISISADENTLYLANTYEEDGSYKGGGLSYSERTADGWSMPKKIIIRQFYNQSNNLQNFCFSPSRKQLLLSLQRRDTRGGVDLYVCFRESEGIYSPPVNLGSDINMPDNEFSPFIAADNRTLYFSSNRRGGEGESDIYVSRREDNSWKRWSTPENLGPVVNSPGFDAFYSVTPAGDYAYFSRRVDKADDIFRIALNEKDARPDPTVLVKGFVRNADTDDPVAAEIRYFDIETSEEIGLAHSSQVDGAYQVLLPAGKRYSFRAEKSGFFSISENLDLKNTKSYEELDKDLRLAPLESGKEIRLNNLFFKTGKAELNDNSMQELGRLVSFLEENPELRIEINGHTDSQGGDDTNQVLSEDRARAVVVHLLTRGISPDRLNSRGFGETRPVATNDTSTGRAKNRRVTFRIL